MDESKPKTKILKAAGKWMPPVKVTVSAGGYDGIVMDQPPEFGGTAEGPTPMDMVMAALIGCAGQTIAYVARELAFQYKGATFEAEAEMDLRGFMGMQGICRHFCGFSGTFVIDTNETQERLEQVRDLVENRCPVFNLLHDAGVRTNIEWKIK